MLDRYFQIFYHIVFPSVGCLSCFISIYFFLYYGYKINKIPLIETSGIPEINEKLVSVVIPARNEDKVLSVSVNSILQQHHKNLQIILVNDRSTDRTPQIMIELANKDNRIELVTIQELPNGWLGKPYALQMGTIKAKGEYILICDADTILAPKVIDRAIHISRKDNVDLVTIKARFSHSEFFLNIILSVLSIFLLARWVSDENSLFLKKLPKGYGSFNFFKASSYKQTGGITLLRMEILDDIGIGYLFNQAGLRNLLFLTHSELFHRWYGSIREAFKGLEKNLFTITSKYNYSILVINCLLILFVVIGPWFIILNPYDILYFLGGTTAAALIIFSITVGKHTALSPVSLFFIPLGLLFILVALINSAALFYLNDGISWKETHYASRELKNGRVI